MQFVVQTKKSIVEQNRLDENTVLRPKTTENLHPKSDRSSSTAIVTQTENSNVTQNRTGSKTVLIVRQNCRTIVEQIRQVSANHQMIIKM
jgi:hypothetical protein